jgi:integrase
MPKQKLTDFSVKSAKGPVKGRTEIWDTLLPGFGLRVSDKGTKTFQFMYRFEGELRRETLGQSKAMTLAEARDKAEAIVKAVKRGIDPKHIEAEEKAEKQRQRANTFGSIVEQFIEIYAKPKNKGWAEVQRYFERDLADWYARPIASITRRDVIAAIDRKAKAGSVYAANRLLAHTRKLFNWSVGRDIIAASPVIKVEGAGAEQERERVLAAAEIKSLWDAWGKMGEPFGPLFQLLLVTGQRRDEVGSMRWPEIRPRQVPDAKVVDMTPVEWVWTIPGERNKAGRSHEIPLSSLAMEILGSVLRTGSPYVFHSRTHDDGCVSGFSRAKEKSDALASVSDWRLHDLRRTCGTGMAKAGVAVSTISRVLNHAEGGVTKIYNRYSYGPEKQRALETWGRIVDGIVRPAEQSNVVQVDFGSAAQ